ncbi:class I SAM-dependent methyltransferase, partial [Pyxidicoccus sp. 3LFB2]
LLAARGGREGEAVDFAPRMIAALRERAAEARLDVESLVGDGMALPLKDGAFDAAFSMFGLMFFPDRPRGFRELHRVLVPGGRAVVSSWMPMERSPVMNAVYKSFAELMSGGGGGGGGAPRDGMMPLSDPETCRKEMAGAGFVDVSVHEAQAPARYGSSAELVDAMIRSSAPIVLARKALGEKWDGVARALLERVSAELGSGPQVLAFHAYLTVGMKK